MSRQIKVDLIFNANTQQAKTQMVTLQKSINSIQSSMNNQISMKGLTSEISSAMPAIMSLKNNLQSAFDVTTGKLDLSKFNTQMQQSNMSLRQYRTALTNLGPEGQKAFQQLTQSIIQGQIPIKKTKNLLTSMMDTFGNSIKWSMAYGAINRISQGFSNALQYAQDLNESLTNIRIVTGLSAEEMDVFAEKANKAAKSLATSTKSYTDAALIYYQQGLEGKAVEERAETTLKLANVTGQSAEEISQQLTAVWNNFYDGSKSIEYYADVMTALGAATASSSDEIAQGLEKFAAVADTVGLSYEYATTALATVTAQTRQSADVVGTAFKTLFARIQDLELGETLEDGTTLGQYSEALYKVGVDIKDASGGLRDMDDILDDMGAKWKTIDKDQQVALAKSVAGIRQYTQLIALMDNWDTFEMNLTVAEGAEGTLQEQQDIWAESWEAAQKRVQASAEDLYKSLIDDKAFINLNNIFADLLSTVDSFLDAIGGLKTVLPLIAGLMLKAFGPTMVGMFRDFKTNLTAGSRQAQQNAMNMRTEALRQLNTAAGLQDTQEGYALQDTSKGQLEIIRSVESLTRDISKGEAEKLQFILNQNKALGDQLVLLGKASDEANERTDNAETEYKQAKVQADNAKYKVQGKRYEEGRKQQAEINQRYTKATKEQEKLERNIALAERGAYDKDGKFNVEALKNNSDFAGVTNEKGYVDRLTELKGRDYVGDVKEKFNGRNLTPKAKEYLKLREQEAIAEKKLNTEKIKGENITEDYNNTQRDYTRSVKDTRKEVEKLNKVPIGEKFVGIASGIGMAASGISMLTSGFESLKDMLTGNEFSFSGLMGSISSLVMAIPMVVSGFKQINSVMAGTQARLVATTLANTKLTMAEKEATLVSGGLNQKKAAQIALSSTKLTQDQKQIILSTTMNAKDKEEALIKSGLTKTQAVELLQNKTSIGLHLALFKAKMANMAIDLKKYLLYIAIIAAVVGLIAVIKALTNWYNADAIAAKEAAKEAEELKKAYEETKQAYEDLKSSISDYHDAQTAIDALTEGTKEWKEAIWEANQEVLELLAKYPELNRFVTTAQNGRITISDEGFAFLQNQEFRRVEMSSLLAMAGNIRSQRAKQKSNITNFSREFGGVGSVDGFNAEGRDEQWIRDKIDTLTTEYLEKGEKVFLGLDKELEDLGDNSGEVAEKIKNLVRQEKSLAIAEENLLRQRMNSILTDGLGYNTHILTEGVQKHMANVLKNDSTYQAFENINLNFIEDSAWAVASKTGIGLLGSPFGGIIGLGTSLNNIDKGKTANKYVKDDFWSWGSTEEGNKILQEYFDDMGIKADVEDSDFHKKNVTYTTRDGEEKTVSYDTLLEWEKQQYLESRTSEFQAIAHKIYATGKKLKRSANDAEQALGEYLDSGDLAALDVEVYDTLTASGTNTKEQIKTALDKYGDLLKQLGYNIDEITDDMAEQLAGYTREEVIANRLQRDQLAYESTIEQGATSLEIDKNVLDAYAESLRNTHDELAKVKNDSAEVAVEHFKMSKGIIELRKTLEEHIDTLKAADKNSLEYAEALGAIKTSIDKIFGSDVSFDFVKSEMSNIQDMLDGSIEAYDKVRKALVKDWVKNLELDESQIKQIDTLFERLMKKADEGAATIEIKADETAAIDSINELVRKGLIAESELEAAFRNAKLEWGEDTTFTTYSLPQGTTSRSKVTAKDGQGNEVATYDIETYNETTQTLPWIGDNPPVFKSIAGSDSLAKAKANLKLDKIGTTNINSKDINNDQVKLIDDKGKVIESDEDFERAQESGGVIRYGYYDDNGKLVKSGDSSSKFSFTTEDTHITSDILTRDGKANETAADRKKRLKDLDKEIERYHEIDETIQDLERDLNKISKAKDRAFGANKLALIDKEIAKQKELVKADEERLKQAEKWYEVDRKNLLNSYAVKLDQDGRIANYEELVQKQVNKLKGMSETDQGYEDQREYLDQMKEDFAQYEETLDEVNDQQQAIIDKQYELQDLAMEKIEYTVQIKVDATDDDLALIEFLKQGIEDNEFAAAEKIKYATDEIGIIQQKINAKEMGIGQIEEQVASGDLSVGDAIEKLREYRDEIIDLNGELAEQRNAIFESLGETFEAYNEELDRATEKIEFLSGTMEHYSNLVDIVGKKALGIDNQTLRDMSKETVNLAKNSYEIAKNNLTANEKVLSDLQNDRANLVKTFGANSEEVRLMDEQIRIVEDKIQEGYEAVHEAEQATLEAIADDFKQHIDLIMEEFENAVSGIYNSLDELQSAFDRQKEINDRYLEQYEKTYEINKLNRRINQSLDKTDNLKSQKQLRELQSQLLAMNEAGVEVSQRDIEYMQKKYELMLAQQALEDAQNAKSVVRLQRDSEGNYGYVYTADQNNIDSAQQNYEDKLYAMQKYGEESLTEIQEQLLATNQEFADAMRELSENNNLSQAEFMQKKEELIAFYTEKMRYWIGEANNQLQYAGEINSQYNTDMAASFNDTIMSQMYPDLQNFEGYYLQATEAMGIASQEFSIAVDEYYGQIQIISGDTKDKINVDLKKIRDDSAATEKSAQQLATKMETEMSRASGYVQSFANEYGTYMNNVQTATQTTIEEVGNLIDKYEDLIEKKQEAAQDYSAQGTQKQANNTTLSINNNKTSNEVGKVEQMQKWAKSVGANPGTIDNQWGKNTKAAMEKAASSHLQAPITFKDENAAWDWYNTYILQDQSGTTLKDLTSPSFSLVSGWKKRLQDYAKTGYGENYYTLDGGGNWQSYANKYKLWNWFSDKKDGTKITGQAISTQNNGTIYSIKIDGKHAYVSEIALMKLTNSQYSNFPSKFDTGGYTGSWGPEGRIAMLHQKEIVLNASDTENFLTAIEIVRSIANQMNLNNQRLSDYAKTSTTIGNVSGDTLQQEVTIHAEFPNATNHNEIEEAFGNLVNLAAQYTNRKF